MESVENDKGLSPAEKHEGGIFAAILEKLGAKPIALAAVFAGTTGACSHYSTSETVTTITNPIGLSPDAYCSQMDYLADRAEGSRDRVTLQGTNGRVIVQGIVENGQVVATVAVTTPDGRTQSVNCD